MLIIPHKGYFGASIKSHDLKLPTLPPILKETKSRHVELTNLSVPNMQVRRQTLAPLTEESVLRVAACFGAPRAVPVGHSPHLPSRTRRSVDSLYVMASNGSLIQYDLEPRHLSGTYCKCWKFPLLTTLHDYNTKNGLVLICLTDCFTLFEKSPLYAGLKLYNNLPCS